MSHHTKCRRPLYAINSQLHFYRTIITSQYTEVKAQKQRHRRYSERVPYREARRATPLDHRSICDTNRAHMVRFRGDARLASAAGQSDAFSSSMVLAPGCMPVLREGGTVVYKAFCAGGLETEAAYAVL